MHIHSRKEIFFFGAVMEEYKRILNDHYMRIVDVLRHASGALGVNQIKERERESVSNDGMMVFRGVRYPK